MSETDRQEDRLKRLEEDVRKIKGSFPYFLVMGASWAMIWAALGAWWQRNGLWVPW